MFARVLIANRGEIAVRIIRACRELGIESVAVYSTADREALHRRLADRSICIGPPAPQASYLNIAAIVSAALAVGADAIHPGCGFLAERGDFAEACVRSGLAFIGPRVRNIRLMGDKPRARRLMARKGIPTLMGSRGPVAELEEAEQAAEAIGYPVVVKAAAGGGGRGLRIASDPQALRKVFPLARREAEAAFGDGRLYLERHLERARHIEVQVAADRHGNCIHLGERDCSIQWRYQKVLEEAPAARLEQSLREKICQTAVRAAQVIGYTNVGTVEFLLDRSGEFFFIEMNTRIQVEHAVTEMVTGEDLVKLGILAAAGLPLGLRQSGVRVRGNALECRIKAENALTHLPSRGPIKGFHLPGGAGIRVESALANGAPVPVEYDSLLAKIIGYGKSREEAIARMRVALQELFIDGVETNIELHRRILRHPDFLNAKIDTGFLARLERDEVFA